MNKIAIDRSVVEQALETLSIQHVESFMSKRVHAITALRAALEQAQIEQEPVGEAGSMPGTDGFTMACFRASDVPAGTKLYTHAQPPRQPLTEEEIRDLFQNQRAFPRLLKFIRVIEAAHGIGGEK